MPGTIPSPVNTPNPDPTVLTTAALLREVSTLRDSSKAEVAALKDIIVTRLTAMDKAVELVQASHLRLVEMFHAREDKFDRLIDDKISSLQEVHDEKFRSISVQFTERDTRTEQNQKDTKVAVDAALQAAEKAVGKQQESFSLATDKSEKATTKQIDQQGLIISTATRALDDKIEDLKQRLTRIEGSMEGRLESKTTGQNTGNYILAIISAIIAAGAVIISVVINFRR
jgi:hypothetical protein